MASRPQRDLMLVIVGLKFVSLMRVVMRAMLARMRMVVHGGIARMVVGVAVVVVVGMAVHMHVLVGVLAYPRMLVFMLVFVLMFVFVLMMVLVIAFHGVLLLGHHIGFANFA